MSRLTICPHFLFDYKSTSPAEIEKKIIDPLLSFANASFSSGVPIFLSSEILSRFQNSYPWDKISDPQWKGYILSWNALIVQKILGKAHIISVPKSSSNLGLCAELNFDVDNIFAQFIEVFLTKKMPKSSSEEGVFSGDFCAAGYSKLNCCVLASGSDIKFVQYPWLRVYDARLPVSGEYPFDPPANWRSQSCKRKGPMHGYLDAKGIEWIWDKLHDDHWDVQDGSPYKNVSPNGTVLS